MPANHFLQILVVNPIREGIGKVSKNPYKMQDCECAILDDKGVPQQVGVLMLSKEQTGNVTPGYYSGSFEIRADTSRDGGRKIGAVLVDLVPHDLTPRGFVVKGAGKSPAAPAA